MTRNGLPPEGGTQAQPVPVPTGDENELSQIAQDLACPHCGSDQVQIVGMIAPDDERAETVRTYKLGLTGAGVGGAVGALLGPVGVAGGMALGSLLGSNRAQRENLKQRAETSCPDCGHHGRGN